MEILAIIVIAAAIWFFGNLFGRGSKGNMPATQSETAMGDGVGCILGPDAAAELIQYQELHSKTYTHASPNEYKYSGQDDRGNMTYSRVLNNAEAHRETCEVIGEARSIFDRMNDVVTVDWGEGD